MRFGWNLANYEHPYPEVDVIAGHVAFYADRVRITETEEAADTDPRSVRSTR